MQENSFFGPYHGSYNPVYPFSKLEQKCALDRTESKIESFKVFDSPHLSKLQFYILNFVIEPAFFT
jgi:hypothetical protein